LPGFEMVGWFGVVAPVGTPQSMVQRLNQEINKLLAEREVADRILTIGTIVEPGGSMDQFAGFLRDEHLRWGQVAKEISLLPE
jgi:tripartite-type tricarboxylate transporter receptor subunit TctC